MIRRSAGDVSTNPSTPNVSEAAKACLRHGGGLLEDARLLLDWDRPPTALAVAMLAQEEFAKTFVLRLVKDGYLPWTLELHRSLSRHECKQLLVLIMDWLSIPLEEEIERGLERREMPNEVGNAINILRHEKIEGMRGGWAFSEPEWNGLARRIAKGSRDRDKQRGLYVSVTPTGWIGTLPSQVTADAAQKEIEMAERARRLAEDLWRDPPFRSLEYEDVAKQLKTVFFDLFPDPDKALIEAVWETEDALNSHVNSEAEHLVRIVCGNRQVKAPIVEVRPSSLRKRLLGGHTWGGEYEPAEPGSEARVILFPLNCTDSNLIRIVLTHGLVHHWEHTAPSDAPLPPCPSWLDEMVRSLFETPEKQKAWRAGHSERFTVKAAVAAQFLKLPTEKVLAEGYLSESLLKRFVIAAPPIEL